MLFNSFSYVFVFFPVAAAVYFLLNHNKLTLAAKAWLVLASIFFYGWWNPKYVPLLLGSILFNYGAGTVLLRPAQKKKKLVLAFCVAMNLALLAYFKYADFLLFNFGALTGRQLKVLGIILPLGISFFTFTQIAYLVDTYKAKVRESDFLNYCLFVTYFPHLLAGPILHHSEMMPQFDRARNKIFSHRDFYHGFYLFMLGLGKKVLIADYFALYANQGFARASDLDFIAGWVTALSYSIQLYFDFSGYTDMAIGSSLILSIKLPANFNSPYKALDIQDFWRRWHMTLSRFLRDYVYIPLGGNRASEALVCWNLVLTFLIGGLWHGAAWTFVFWGFLHGVALVVNRQWRKSGVVMPAPLARAITFIFVTITWVFFRANGFGEAWEMIKSMGGANGILLPGNLKSVSWLQHHLIDFGSALNVLDAGSSLYVFVGGTLLLLFICKNTVEIMQRLRPSWKSFLAMSLLAVFAISNLGRISEFIYFNF